MAYRLGVDVGGTFTDVCVIAPDGDTIRAKTPTTSPDQSVGIQNGIAKVRKTLRARDGWDGEFSYIHHGSTIATNAVLESRGVKAGLVVTAGFKEVLSNRRSQIPGGLGGWINYVPPEPVVPLERTVQCTGRISATGEVVVALDEDALRADLAGLARQQPQAVTISLLNSYVNDAHERTAARIVREELGPAVEIVCSADVLPEAGEYERTVTAAANGVVKPIVKRYLAGLRDLLRPDSRTIRILKSDGALTSLAQAGELPVNLLMSGPAGGVQGVVDVVAKQTTYRNLITLDMGGTSTDVALVADGKPALRRETIVDKLTVRAPSVDVRTVGAGGGSVARFTHLTNSMRVGPESAGASPGPACYRMGGTAPTVTDANLVLGYLPDKLLGGDFPLHLDAATTAVKSIADQMGLSVEETAAGILDLANETMYRALRQVSVEQGYDPRDFALVAFGGAGPLHANAVGKLLGAWPIVVPRAPGVLCAQGDATTKLSESKSVSYIRALSQVSLADLQAVLDGLEEHCVRTMNEALEGASDKQVGIAYEADLRYHGQALDIAVTFAPEELAQGKEALFKLLTERFRKLHELQFGFSMDDLEFELVRLGVTAAEASPPVRFTQMPSAGVGDEVGAALERAVLDRKMIVVEGQRLEAKLYDRARLQQAGVRLDGPCIITEMDSNTLVLPGFYGEIDPLGNILIWPAGDAPPSRGRTFTPESAREEIAKSPLVPTLVGSALQAVRVEMDTLVLRCAMSPGIREQQDEFNVVTNEKGQMLVGQFGSFIGQFLRGWEKVGGTVHEGDIFITNDPYSTEGAISHLNDVIIMLPIYHQHRLVGWSANFGHLSDVGGEVPGSMGVGSSTIFQDGVQIPPCKLYKEGVYNADVMNILCRNSRMPDWYRSDIAALVSSCKTAGARVCELIDRFGLEIYQASCEELLRRNKMAVTKLIETQFGDEEAVFTDFIDDGGNGEIGPLAVRCRMAKRDGRLGFDFDGTAVQTNTAVNFYLSPTMFKMLVGYYLLAVFDPHCTVNEGLYDAIDVAVPEGSIVSNIRLFFVAPLGTDNSRRTPVSLCPRHPSSSKILTLDAAAAARPAGRVVLPDAPPGPRHGRHPGPDGPAQPGLPRRRRLLRLPALLLLGLPPRRQLLPALLHRLRRRPRPPRRRRARHALPLPLHQVGADRDHRARLPAPHRGQRVPRRHGRRRVLPGGQRPSDAVPVPQPGRVLAARRPVVHVSVGHRRGATGPALAKAAVPVLAERGRRRRRRRRGPTGARPPAQQVRRRARRPRRRARVHHVGRRRPRRPRHPPGRHRRPRGPPQAREPRRRPRPLRRRARPRHRRGPRRRDRGVARRPAGPPRRPRPQPQHLQPGRLPGPAAGAVPGGDGAAAAPGAVVRGPVRPAQQPAVCRGLVPDAQDRGRLDSRVREARRHGERRREVPG